MESVPFSSLCKFQPKQLEATELADLFQYFLYGGSRGPGKSYWLRWYLLRELLKLAKNGVLNAVVGLFCEDYPALTDRQTSKIAREFPTWLGTLKDSKTTGFGFYVKEEYGGGVLALRNLDDVSKYQSAEFAAIGVDELTKNPENTFDILRGSLRWKGVAKPKFIAATNPGGEGHVWVKRYWVDGNLPERFKSVKDNFKFLSALPTDNKYLDPSYWEMLETLPDRLKRAWRYGDWNAFEGQFFSFDEATQLVEPFEIPAGWNLIAGLDPGYSSPCSFSISAMDYEGNLYRVATYYESSRSPKENATGIRQFIDSLAFTNGRMPRIIVADPSAFAKKDKWAIESSQMTFADICRNEGLILQKGMNDRVQGWWALKDMMTRKNIKIVDGKEVKTPKYFVFDGLNQPFVDELTAAIGDDKRPEDIQGRGNDPAVSDHCFVKGTRVLTSKGYKPIDEINEGESVLTSVGYKRVVLTHKIEKQVVDYYVINGKIIGCTPSHKFKTIEGYKRIHNLTNKDILCIFGEKKRNKLWQNTALQKLLSLIRSSLGAILNQTSLILGTIIDVAVSIIKKASGICTYIFGNLQTAKYQLDIISTTKTATHKITNYQILNANLNQNTYQNTLNNGRKKIKSGLKTIWATYGTKLKNGTHQKRAEIGTASILKKLLRIEKMSGLKNTVWNAIKYFFLKRRLGNTAIQIVKLNSTVKDVYDLTVEDIHEYCVEGYIVHNSLDEERYKIMAIYKPIDVDAFKKKREAELMDIAYPQIELDKEIVSDTDLQF